MPSPEARERALLLIRKAVGDESFIDKLVDDPDISDDLLGFHAQQAVEKRLKAVLAFNEVDYERTHSIGYLTSLLEHHGIDFPDSREQIEELTPWAVAARYEDSFEEVLDRSALPALLSVVRDWSEHLLGDEQLDSPQ